MSMLLSLIGTPLILVLVAILWGVSAYDSLVKVRNVIQESWRQTDVEPNRRYDPIPSLIETVCGHASHERGVLEKAISLRQNVMVLAAQVQGAPNEQRAAAEPALTETVRGLMVSVESHPNLKSNTNYLKLQRELADIEDRIAASRRLYNADVRDYNTRIESVPTNIIAGMGKFERVAYFEVNDSTVRRAPTANFGQPPAETRSR